MNGQLWYYHLVDEEFGPIDGALLKQLIENHRLQADNWVRPEDDPHWRTVRFAPEIMTGEIFDQPFEGTTEAFPTTNRDSVLPTSDHDSMPSTTTQIQSQDAWYYKVFGQEMGPISFEELNSKTHNFEISREDEVRQGAKGSWVAAESIEGLFAGVDEMDLSEMDSVGFIAPQRSQPSPVKAPIELPAKPKSEESPAIPTWEPPSAEPEKPTARPATSRPTPTRSTSIPTSAPVSRPTPRPQFTPTRKSGSSSWLSDFSFGDMFSSMTAVKLDGKFYAMIAVVVLYVGYIAVQPLFRKASDAIYLKRTADLIAECKNSGKTPAQLAQEIQPRIDAMKAEIEEKANADRPVLRILLETHREHFPTLLNGKPQEQQAAMRRIESNLNAARQHL